MIGKVEYHSKILTPYLQFDILELPKAIKEYQNNKDDEVLQWLMFLDNPENTEIAKIMEENKDIKVAKEELDQMSKDDVLWWLSLREELARMDHEQLMYESKREGIAEGKAKGKTEGRKENSLEIAKKMLKKNIPLEEIIEITRLTKEEILKVE